MTQLIGPVNQYKKPVHLAKIKDTILIGPLELRGRLIPPCMS